MDNVWRTRLVVANAIMDGPVLSVIFRILNYCAQRLLALTDRCHIHANANVQTVSLASDAPAEIAARRDLMVDPFRANGDRLMKIVNATAGQRIPGRHVVLVIVHQNHVSMVPMIVCVIASASPDFQVRIVPCAIAPELVVNLDELILPLASVSAILVILASLVSFWKILTTKVNRLIILDV
jgi:hypothetical protein